MIIIWITWTLAAGKWTLVEYLVENKWFTHYSVTEYLKKECDRRWLPQNRDSYTHVANDLRANNWPWFIVSELLKEAQTNWWNCIIESIRALWEIDILKSQNNCYLFAVDAPIDTRYERAKLRWWEKDQVDYETFVNNEKRELTSTDPNKQNLLGCIARADFVFQNDWDLFEFYSEIDKVLNNIKI